ncbi:MAG: XTP/dITP diphosphohydrolase [Frankiales bacterium]|nr:XTP/dITP diphosphohydrolase [Frankiales bacterium]
MSDRVVLATRNPHKLEEVRRILAPLVDVELLPGPDLDVDETGDTFAANALLKARAVAAATGSPAVADDSGLCVDALDGKPGVLSARWSGVHGDDRANVELVLDEIADVPDERRGAAFICAAALVLPNGREHVVVGQVEGTITREPRGTGGFGYDPIFVPEGESRTTAEMSATEKDALSHRGRAFRALAPVLAKALA